MNRTAAPSAAVGIRRALLTGATAAAALLAAWTAHARGGGVRDQRRRTTSYEADIADLEAIMDRFYRGETIDDAEKRLNSLVDSYNKLVNSRNREMKAAEKKLDKELGPVRALEKEVDAMDAKLARKPDRGDGDAVRAYNALVERRNALVEKANNLGKRAQADIDAHNRYIRQVKAELSSRERKIEAKRAELNARVDAYNRFHKSGKDVAFFASVNRLYGRLREEKRRSGGSPELDRAARKVRALRCELGAHATARHGSDEHGLVVIEVVLNGDEPCFFIVDTGAMQTTIAPGVVEALGLAGELGEEIELVLAGGRKIKGRELVLPSVTVVGRTEKDVPAAAVKVSEVGVDGLLGQSFLKRFVYTIDESTKQKLILRPRP